MRVYLLDYTGAGSGNPWYAADLMIFTKNTRVKMSPDLRQEIAAWPPEKKMKELEYMANTIPSSWEFCDYTFMAEDVSRALTHQLVRTRTASYAQQTMQILDVRGFDVYKGPSIEGEFREKVWSDALMVIDSAYSSLIDDGAKTEDARGLLPTNIMTNIVIKMNLRTLAQFLSTRRSPRNLGEIRLLVDAMYEAVVSVHPWASLFLDRTVDKVTKELDELIATFTEFPETRIKMHKLVDQLRRNG